MDNVYLYMGRRYSKGGVAVAEGLGIKWCKTKVIDYIAKDGDTIINWGTSMYAPGSRNVKQIQKPEAVFFASNKLSTLLQLNNAHVSVPNFTTNKKTVEKTVHEGEGTVTWFARHTLTGSGGKGIEIVDNFLNVPDAPLYTKYIKSDYEIRVHVGMGPRGPYAFDIQQKMKKKDAPPDNGMVKNHDRGYVFVRNAINAPGDVLADCKRQAELAIGALGLDFGAVDIVCSGGKAYVLEVNTSPGLEGTTLERYSAMLRRMVNVDR